ncbi:hypothetical protein BCT63_20570, partial [Vibrio kanaloae]|uniref:flippase n=1 Tax=Vibrio kanaloae TaxID=170673 RepID=UPI000CB9B966
ELRNKAEDMVKKSVISNIIWLVFEKVYKVVLSLLTVIFIARHYGPELYGELTYALTVLSLLTTIVIFGMKSIVVKDIVKSKNTRIIKSALLISSPISVFLFLIYIILIFLVEVDFNTLNHFLIILSVLFRPMDIIKFYYEAKVISKNFVRFESIIFILSFLVKISFPIFGLDIFYVFVTILTENLIVFSYLIYLSKRDRLLISESVTVDDIKGLIKRSLPLFLASGAWLLYTKIDQLMVTNILGMHSQGTYYSSIQISELIILLPTVVIASLVPGIEKEISNKKSRNKKYQELYRICFILLIPFIITFQLFSEDILVLIFGSEYREGYIVLGISSLSSIFIVFSMVSGQYLLYQGKQKIILQRQLLGLFINICLNYKLIDVYGINGAALSTLISLFFATFVFDLLSNSTKICFLHKCKSLIFWKFKNVF